MKLEADGFSFDFTDALDGFVFDEKDKTQAHYHGLSHAMKAVDIIVELENDYLFIEIKDFHAPDDYDFQRAINEDQHKERMKYFNHLREVLKGKYRDTWMYRWAENKLNKPVRYLCLLTLDNALLTRMNKELRQQLPVAKNGPRWTHDIASSAIVVNVDRWNKAFTAWPVVKI